VILPEELAAGTSTTVEQAERRISRYERTFRSIRPWLPPGLVLNFLDIGCGTGGVAMRVAGHYPNATAHLIDGDAWGEKFSYRPDGRPWADVKLALKLWAKYLPNRAVRAWPPDPALTIPCELIYSNCSWGHHYAIETYLGLARRSLQPGGTLIVDLRVGNIGEHGRKALGAYFAHVADIEVGQKKYARTVWRNAR